ncbi:MAG: sensor histidine kinase, partial [Promethearchaeota archaeon]
FMVYSSAEFLLNELKHELGKNALKMVEHIFNGAKRLRKLINNILDVSRIELGKFALDKTKFDLVKLIRECIDQINYRLKTKKQNLKTDLPSSLEIVADQERIRQVLINLMTNAIKNTPNNGNIEIMLQKMEDDNQVIFKIKDDGIGITTDEMKFLFAKFGKITRKNISEEVDLEGSGIGLYVSKKIIEYHEGNIKVKSEGRNKGAEFSFLIPINGTKNRISQIQYDNSDSGQ